jgi:hypothetical protein
MSSEYEEFINSQKKVSNEGIETNKNKESNSEIIRRLDLVLKKLEGIEEHLGINTKTIYDDMKPAYSVKDTAAILGCSQHKVRQYIKYDMLETFKVGSKKMVHSKSITKLIKENQN